MKRTTIFCIVLAVFLAFPVFAEKVAMPSLTMPTAASNGFGGHHVAYTDNVYSLLVNPAAMIRVQQRSFLNIAPSLLSPGFLQDILKPIETMVADNDMSAIGDMADALSDKEGKIALGMELREFPLSIAWVANGFGFGLWNRLFVNANIDGSTVRSDIYADVMLPVGFAFKILDIGGHTLDAGVTLKPFGRVRATVTENIIDLTGDTDDFVDRLNIPVIVGSGVDLGLMYRWGGLRAGLAFNDVYSRGEVVYNVNPDFEDTSTYYVPFTMNFGIAYEFKLAFARFAIAADWRDITNVFDQDNYLESRNFLLDFGAGLQVSLFDIVTLRGGFSEMLPSVGVGLDLGPLAIDAAYYGKEFGYEPGQLSAAVLEVSIAIRPGAKKRNWPWARRAVFGMFGVGE